MYHAEGVVVPAAEVLRSLQWQHHAMQVVPEEFAVHGQIERLLVEVGVLLFLAHIAVSAAKGASARLIGKEAVVEMADSCRHALCEGLFCAKGFGPAQGHFQRGVAHHRAPLWRQHLQHCAKQFAPEAQVVLEEMAAVVPLAELAHKAALKHINDILVLLQQRRNL